MSCNFLQKNLNNLDPEVKCLVSGGEGAGFADRRPFCIVEPLDFGGGSEVWGRHTAGGRRQEGKFHNV